jgi:flagellar biosynthetic protein FlhB
MANTGNKTEKPTQRRLQKARREGNFASSRDFVGGLQFTLIVVVFMAFGGTWVATLKRCTRAVIQQAFNSDLDSAGLAQLIASTFKQALAPVAFAGGVLVLTALAFQFASTRMGFSLTKLAPSAKHFQPFSKIKAIPSQGIPSAVQAIFMLVLSAVVLYWLALSNAHALFLLPLSSLDVGLAKMRSVCLEVLWKGAALLLVFGFVDLFRQKRVFAKQMRMTKQEIRDELKETEGNPQMKARVRRLQRDLRRRKMISEVATATAVIVNPTHYAVAIRYHHETMSTPVVVAKGRNHLALRIRQHAIHHQVPLIENPPLAQALYKSVKVGQEIPTNFYRAIAEILAYVYRLMGTQL